MHNRERILWQDPAIKESHRGKPLVKHLEEVESIFSTFAEFYDIEKWALDLTLPIIRYHDNGKLNPAWRYDDPNKPVHSEYSIRYLKDKNLLKKLDSLHGELFPVILYLILKHHSSLYDGTRSKDYIDLCRDVVRYQIRKQSKEKRIEIIDSFGLFKIADCLSASNIIDFGPKYPDISLEMVSKILSKRTGYIDNKRWNEQKQLMNLPNSAILTAYTGWGKTDSALLFCTRYQNVKKIFYLFPMITAINKFYDKLSAYVANVEKYFYLYEYEIASRHGEPDDESHELNISSFMASHFLSSIMLTTVDQFLLSFLQVGKYYMKRVMFRDAAIVVDEVHLLNPKMLSLLLHFFRTFIPIYKFRVLFMSATFSNALMTIIKEELGPGAITPLDFSEGYKELLRVKYTTDTFDRMILEDIARIERLATSEKVLVVANTVESAMLIFKSLEKNIPSSRLILLHGKFMYRDRIVKEKDIDRLEDYPHVLVTTQVCEVSLDVSYNTMFTEMAPLPSLVQRFGRVNRYERTTEVDNVYIYKEYRKNYSDQYYPYEENDMVTAKKILEKLYPIKNEYDLIEEYNNVENYRELRKRMKEANDRLDFRALWENDNRTAYFFSFKIDEEETRRLLLEFRDSITVNVLPHPECIKNKVVKEDLEILLANLTNVDASTYGKIKQILMALRGYLVSIPTWQALKYGVERLKGFPIFKPNDLEYSSVYGFIKRT